MQIALQYAYCNSIKNSRYVSIFLLLLSKHATPTPISNPTPLWTDPNVRSVNASRSFIWQSFVGSTHWRASPPRQSWRPPWCSTFHDALIVDVEVEGLHGVFLAGSGAIVGTVLPHCLQGSSGGLPLGHSSWWRQGSGLQFWWHGNFVVMLVLTVALLLSASSVF